MKYHSIPLAIIKWFVSLTQWQCVGWRVWVLLFNWANGTVSQQTILFKQLHHWSSSSDLRNLESDSCQPKNADFNWICLNDQELRIRNERQARHNTGIFLGGPNVSETASWPQSQAQLQVSKTKSDTCSDAASTEIVWMIWFQIMYFLVLFAAAVQRVPAGSLQNNSTWFSSSPWSSWGAASNCSWCTARFWIWAAGMRKEGGETERDCAPTSSRYLTRSEVPLNLN